MALQEKYGVIGLATSPNPKQLKDGALRVAHNVTFRRPGMVEPRPGFENAYALSAVLPIKLLPFDGDILNVGTVATKWSGSAAVKDENAADIQWDLDRVLAAEARKNLYLTTSDAVRKLTASGDVVAGLAGMIPPPYFSTACAASGTLLDAGDVVAYRFTVSRKDANGVEVTSAPTARFLLEANADDKQGALRVYFNPFIAAGDVLRGYRSAVVPNTVTPSDDLRQVIEYTVLAADVSSGFSPQFLDDVADAARGAALYTNPTREGIDRQNAVSPRVRDLALFKGSLFGADLTYPPALQFAATYGTNITSYVKSSTRTHLSADVVVANTTNLKVGQMLSDAASWSGTGPVRITAIVGTTLTLSETWSGATDGAPVSLTFLDTLRIKTATEDHYYSANTSMALVVDASRANTTRRTSPSTEVRVYGVNDVSYVVDTGNVERGQRRILQIEAFSPTHAGFEVFATHGSYYEPALPEPTETSGLVATQDVFPNGVAWSKQDEPEHFMLSRYWLVGNQKAPVVRIVPTQDALYVFKGPGDGIYRLSGFGERSGWRVDPVDASTYLLHPELAVANGDAVYAWTNIGLVMISEAGVSKPLSTPIANLTRDLEATFDGSGIEGGDLYANRAFAIANNKDAEMIFGLPRAADTTGEPVSTTYVLNMRSSAWSTWFDSDTIVSATYNPGDRLIYYAVDGSNTVHSERAFDDAHRNADFDISPITVTDVTGNTVTINSSGWSPAVGDMFGTLDGSRSTIVTAVYSAESFDVADPAVVQVGTSQIAFTGVPCELQWHPHWEPGTSAVKRYQSLFVHWEDTFGVYTWDTTLSSTFNGDDQYVSDTFDYSRDSQTEDTRTLINREAAYAPQLYTTLTIRQADARFRISGIALDYDAVSKRVWR